ncbi:allantoate deiminase [Dethiosulfatibacter aminovorans DSM 17477]|uniref:Allantoate deiminase n=1 Tax=Dethiosulfatibacter aminovorans DSM 17477 TaxID=1121476 RepID=A0A1M6BRR4_9FIRM|nr:Zn-dependent hydrolase [Dethiosulfatibacter aminovorans]SHI51429.1 allantoate deiminase [Dethiosulfatibacter aminovorans DSM 17477]
MKTNLDRIVKDIEELSKFNSTPGRGLTRFSFTEEDRQARNYIKRELEKLDLYVYEDAAGTVFGRMKDYPVEMPSIMVGSHFDSVKNGGNFDGPAGIAMGLEVMRSLVENNVKTAYPVEFVGMIEEEGGRFGGGVFGSRAMTVGVTLEELKANCDSDGISMAEAMASFGLEPEKISSAKRSPDEIRAFIELHIEQGPVLEKENLDVGLVEYIVGIAEYRIGIKGRPDHAGTTPMNLRKDALIAASELVCQIEELALSQGDGTVATVGAMDVFPGAANIVPGEVELTVDIRSRNQDCIDGVVAGIKRSLKDKADSRGLAWEMRELLNVTPVTMSEKILNTMQEKADEGGIGYKKMTSGAGHDAMIMASMVDSGLVFVPSRDGRSHCPEEWTDYDQLQKGIELIYHTILGIGEVE